MTVALTELKKGDKILIEATVTGRKAMDGTVIVQHNSLNEFRVHRDIDVKEIVQYALAVGDRVKWHEKGQWQFGTVLAIELEKPDSEIDKETWVWVRADITWPRRTFSITELQRA